MVDIKLIRKCSKKEIRKGCGTGKWDQLSKLEIQLLIVRYATFKGIR